MDVETAVVGHGAGLIAARGTVDGDVIPFRPGQKTGIIQRKTGLRNIGMDTFHAEIGNNGFLTDRFKGTRSQSQGKQDNTISFHHISS